jgi:hypothetical protein
MCFKALGSFHHIIQIWFPITKEKQINEKTFAPKKVLKTKILQNCLWPLHCEGFIN